MLVLPAELPFHLAKMDTMRQTPCGIKSSTEFGTGSRKLREMAFWIFVIKRAGAVDFSMTPNCAVP